MRTGLEFPGRCIQQSHARYDFLYQRQSWGLNSAFRFGSVRFGSRSHGIGNLTFVTWSPTKSEWTEPKADASSPYNCTNTSWNHYNRISGTYYWNYVIDTWGTRCSVNPLVCNHNAMSIFSHCQNISMGRKSSRDKFKLALIFVLLESTPAP